MRFMKSLAIAMLLTSNVCLADNCSNFNLWNAASNNWTKYGDVFSVGALFEPAFSGGLAATYVASAGQTAYYSFPSSVTVSGSSTSSYYSFLKASGIWQDAVINEGPVGYVWAGSRGVVQYANKSGQNCSAQVILTPILGSSTQYIGGISVGVTLDNGRKTIVNGTASTITFMSTPQHDVISLNFTLSPMTLNLATSGRVAITVPFGTPDGDYTGIISMPYNITACGGGVACQDPRLLNKIKASVSDINALIKIRVSGGKPVNPDTYCKVSSGTTFIRHGTLTPDMVDGNEKSNSIIIACTGGTKVPVKIKLWPVGSPNTGYPSMDNNGILTPLSNGTDSLVSLGSDRVTEKNIYVNSVAAVQVNSKLKSGNMTVPAGKFSGSAIAEISFN